LRSRGRPTGRKRSRPSADGRPGWRVRRAWLSLWIL
jgi:hypothetical protein